MDKAARAVGRLSSPCTVTHIGFGQGVTAAHCVPMMALRDCSFLSVVWNDPSLPREPADCEEVVFHVFRAGADVAVLRFATAPTSALAFDWGIQSQEDVPQKQFTLLSHPGGGELSSSGLCSAILLPGPRGAEIISETEFAHSCDTVSGSSGAAVLNAETAEIVGIHSAGVSEGSESFNIATFARVLKGRVGLP